MKRSIYLDYAATTPVDADAYAAALPYYKKLFFNPSSSHALGQKVAAAVERAREACAAAINCKPGEIIFNSGGTEGINQAFNCVPSSGKNHIVVSAIEHDAALSCAEKYSRLGYEVEYVKPNSLGMITPEAILRAVKPNTALICVMTVNNITGAVQPIKALAAASHASGALFFTDAVQAVNAVDIDVKDLGVDMLAASGHKFYAPKGVGFLYVKEGIKLDPLLCGGAQEGGSRPGTLNVPGIVGMAVAIEKAKSTRAEYNAHVKEVSSEFAAALGAATAVECGDKIDDIVSMLFAPEINGGRLAVALSLGGVCCSVGSACSAGSATPPRSLVEMNVERSGSSVRFSFGRQTTVEQVRRAARIIGSTVKKFSR